MLTRGQLILMDAVRLTCPRRERITAMAPRRRLLLLVLSLLLPATLLPGASASAQQPSSGSSDPGMQEWVRVPRDQVAAQCGPGAGAPGRAA